VQNYSLERNVNRGVTVELRCLNHGTEIHGITAVVGSAARCMLVSTPVNRYGADPPCRAGKCVDVDAM
jgi:hypothetical protein